MKLPDIRHPEVYLDSKSKHLIFEDIISTDVFSQNFSLTSMIQKVRTDAVSSGVMVLWLTFRSYGER